ncbi:SSI family serine proteinase inhibitor [Kitasatospora sp. McL0602]|uniref:SSI family serine proteinase inhibitor n=1 Tax=Kitasatospora sp. McL0602 TaxID=3439530 RepID=UPI003F89EB75
MRTTLRRLTLAAAVSAVMAGTLAAAPFAVPSATPTSGFIQLYVVREADDSAAEDQSFTCAPNGGHHPDPGGACAAMAAAGGDLDRLAGDPGLVCPDLVDPVTATAYGNWGGQEITWQKKYTSLCLLHRAATPVF